MALILNKNDAGVEKIARLKYNKPQIDDNMAIIDLTKIFSDIVTKSLFTLEQEVDIGGLKIMTNKIIYQIMEKDIIPMHKFMEEDNLSPFITNKIINLLSDIWDNNENFRLSTYEYYLSSNLDTLQNDLKVFKNYENPIKINSIWSYYRFKLNEMYNPLKNFILNCYPHSIYTTANPLYYYIERDIRLESIMFDDSLYLPNKLGAYYKIPLF